MFVSLAGTYWSMFALKVTMNNSTLAHELQIALLYVEFGQPEEPDLALGGSFTVRRRRSEE